MPIAKAVIADVPELNTLVNSAYRGETSKKGWTTEADLIDGLRIDEQTLNDYFSDPDITILKYTDETGKITGCVYLELKAPKMYVGMFSVSPLLQGKGVGRTLLQAAEAYARESGCTMLTMTVISKRHKLLDWYIRRGYRATGEIQPFHGHAKFGTPREFIELVVLEKAV